MGSLLLHHVITGVICPLQRGSPAKRHKNRHMKVQQRLCLTPLARSHNIFRGSAGFPTPICMSFRFGHFSSLALRISSFGNSSPTAMHSRDPRSCSRQQSPRPRQGRSRLQRHGHPQSDHRAQNARVRLCCASDRWRGRGVSRPRRPRVRGKGPAARWGPPFGLELRSVGSCPCVGPRLCLKTENCRTGRTVLSVSCCIDPCDQRERSEGVNNLNSVNEYLVYWVLLLA